MSIYACGFKETDYSAMQGPAPDGFHVPANSEWQGLKTIMDGLGLTLGSDWRTNLYIPFAGERKYSSADPDFQGSNGYYWSSSPNSLRDYEARSLNLRSSSVGANDSFRRAFGFSVRCFKDSFEVPSSSWTVITGTLGSAGIFWNQSQGLISITDGTTGYTMMDKNLGATTVYNNGDTLSEANCGKYYQRGNNYGFPFTGTISKTSSAQVDASGYGPSTANGYYSSDTFIIGNGNWSSVTNDNLRGGETGIIYEDVDVAGIYLGKYMPTQGPCPNGFHIPSRYEGQALINIYTGLGLTGNDNFRTYFKIPPSCCRSRSNGNLDKTNPPMLWTSTSYDNDNGYYILMNSYNSSLVKIDKYYKSVGACIRPLKDESVSPDNSWTTIYDGSSVAANAGIFWSSTLGLISASSDGINWMTIADKNVGATDVYNGTSSSATTGYYFQRGNNYGFPGWSTTSVSKTSSTQVDATGYGPLKYYNSDTFITRSSSPYNWDSSNNSNLWGGDDISRTLSYLEIVAMANAEKNPYTNTLSILNSDKTGYYNRLNSEGHLIDKYISGVSTFPCIDGIVEESEARPDRFYRIYNYAPFGSMTWAVGLATS